MKNKLKICCPTLSIDPESNSGGAVHDRELLKHLAKLGVECHILLPKNRPYEKGIKNWHITYTSITHMFPAYIFNLFSLIYFFELYRKEKFDIIRIHSSYFVGLAAIIFKLFHPEVPIIASYLHLEEKKPLFHLIDKLIMKKFDRIFTISQFSKNEIIKKYKIEEEKIFISYPGVNKKYKPQKKDLSLMKKYKLENKIILLYLGGLKPRKNIKFLIKIMKEIKKENINLLICGSGLYGYYLKFLAKQWNLEKKIIFTGFIKEKEKVKYYNLADIFLLASKKEGFGMIALEAMACGKPVLVSNTSSLPEVIKDNVTGFLAQPENINDWLEKINLLSKNSELRRKMGKAAREYVLRANKNKFNWQKAAQQQYDIFKKLINK